MDSFMRRIDKSIHLSLNYFTWLEQITLGGNVHPKWKNKTIRNSYHKEVIMNLYHCQDGLCAYTEKRLCRQYLFSADKWVDEKYTYENKPEHDGHPDHYNNTLKKDRAWSWDNLFMTHVVVNNNKGIKATLDYLKPDNINYNPFTFFLYNFDFHLYEVKQNENLTNAQIEEIEHQIKDVLFLNHDPIIGDRETLYKVINQLLEYYNNDWNRVLDKICKLGMYEFPTLIEFIRLEKGL
jgi:hypothetical protein